MVTFGEPSKNLHTVSLLTIGSLYTQLDVSSTGSLAQSRQQRDAAFAEAGGQVNIHSITPEEVLEQANRIFSPYKLKVASPLSWFAIWKSKIRNKVRFSPQDS